MKSLTSGLSLQIAISGLQQLMNLHHWRIEYVEDTPPTTQGALLEVRTIRARNVARLYIDAPFWDLSYEDQVERLKHEMFHIVIDPMWEEHEMQMEVFENYTIKENVDHFRRRFVRVMEKAVEHLSRMPMVASEKSI